MRIGGITIVGTAQGNINGTATDLDIASQAQGDILVRGASNWQRLAPGTDNQVLASNGAGVLPGYEDSAPLALGDFENVAPLVDYQTAATERNQVFTAGNGAELKRFTALDRGGTFNIKVEARMNGNFGNGGRVAVTVNSIVVTAFQNISSASYVQLTFTGVTATTGQTVGARIENINVNPNATYYLRNLIFETTDPDFTAPQFDEDSGF